MKEKRLLMLIGTISLSLMLVIPFMVACAAPAPTPTPAPAPTPTPGELPTYGTWRFGSVRPVEDPATIAHQAWVDMVEERSDGRIKIDIYPASQLGGWVEMYEMMATGVLDLACAIAVDPFDPRMAIDWAPYRFFTWEQAKEMYQPGGWLLEILTELHKQNNIHFFGYVFEGFTGVTLTEAPKVLPPEASGVKIRVPNVASWIKAWEALGFLPIAISRAEVYSALQTGVVKGMAGGGTPQLYEFADIQSYWIQTNDWMDCDSTGINLDLWNSLDPRDQKMLQDSFQEVYWAEPNGYNLVFEQEEASWRDRAHEEYGVEIILLDDERLAMCAKAARELAWPAIEPQIGSRLYEIMVKNAAPVE